MTRPKVHDAGSKILFAILLLSGCTHSPPTRFPVLDAPMPAQLLPTRRSAIAPVQLDAVHVPAMLDWPELVTKTSANALTLSDQDQRGAPSGEMMRRTLG